MSLSAESKVESEKNIPMLLLYVMMTLIKLICVNTALSSKTDQDGEGLVSCA